MAEHTEGRAGLDYHAHLSLGRSVVPILVYLTRQRSRGKQRNLNDPIGALSGVVTVSGRNYCHITAAATFLFPETDLYRFEVVFPNGATVTLDDNIDMLRHEELAAFFVPIPTGTTTHAVQFPPVQRQSEQYRFSRNQNIRMFGYAVSQFPPVQVQSELCDGFITHPDPHPGLGFFRHDCTPSHVSGLGSPLFDDQGRLVGISYKREGVTRAINATGIRHELSHIYGLGEMTMVQILEHIKGLGDAQFGNN